VGARAGLGFHIKFRCIGTVVGKGIGRKVGGVTGLGMARTFVGAMEGQTKGFAEGTEGDHGSDFVEAFKDVVGEWAFFDRGDVLLDFFG
jgi:hypothetical protein